MPTYQYQCTACGEGLEAVQKFTDDALTQCPACEGRLRKVFSAVGVVFKGSGFYRTDSRSASPGSGPSKPVTAKSDSAGSSTAGSGSGSSSGSDSGSGSGSGSSSSSSSSASKSSSSGSSGSSSGSSAA